MFLHALKVEQIKFLNLCHLAFVSWPIMSASSMNSGMGRPQEHRIFWFLQLDKNMSSQIPNEELLNILFSTAYHCVCQNNRGDTF